MDIYVQKCVSAFAAALKSKYSIDPIAVKNLWNGRNPPEKDDVNVNLYDMNKAELTSLCKKRGVKCSGSKNELLERLQGKEKGKTSKKTNVKKGEKTVLSSYKIQINVSRNKWNNFEHSESMLVFDKISQKVIGKQDRDSCMVYTLTEEDIEECKKYNFEWILPENLDAYKNNLDDVKVKGMEEDDVKEEDLVVNNENENEDEYDESYFYGEDYE